MSMIMVEQAVLTTVTVPNLVSGSAFEFSRGRNIVSMGWAQSATGGFMTLQAGADIIAEEFMVPILTRYPILPDEFYFNEVVMGGDRLVVRAQNTTGAGIVHRVVAQITYQG